MQKAWLREELAVLRSREKAHRKESGDMGEAVERKAGGLPPTRGFMGSVKRLDLILRTMGSFWKISGGLVACLAAGG